MLLNTVHFDEGEILASNSTKIGDFDNGVSRGDFSFVEMTKLETNF
ncbi:hypothetical protein [Flavobacterium sp. AJR]|nr:hypothetical protein [Flavobacterium sp. AJR]